MLQTRILEGANWADSLEGDWHDLFSNAEQATPFQSPEWLTNWWNTFGRGKRPYVVSVREGDDLVGLFALFKSSGVWTVLRPMGVGASDYLHPLVRKELGTAVGEHLAEGLKAGGTSLIDLHQVREDRSTFSALSSGSEPLVEQATCLVLDLPGSYEDYLKVLSKSLRYDVRRLDKASLASRAKIIRAEEFGVQPALEVFLECHKARWRKRRLPGAFVGRLTQFHRSWIEPAQQAGLLCLSVLTIDGTPKGAVYAMNCGKTCYFYQSGFDPSAASFSPGTLLVAKTIQWAIEEGLSEFDFLRGDEGYKRRWQPARAHKTFRLLKTGSGVLGGTALAWNRVGSRVESRIRARLEGRGLF